MCAPSRTGGAGDAGIVRAVIEVLNSYSAIEATLRAPRQERPELLRATLAPMAGMYRYFPNDVDPVTTHAAGSGFPIDGDDEQCMTALNLLRKENAWARIGLALDAAVEVQLEATPGIEVPDIIVFLMLGNPVDEHFRNTNLGVIGNGSVTGYLNLTIWPDPENVERLEATAVHELHHNLRYAPGGVGWDPETVTVGEHVVSEGLADAFARQLYGDDLGYTRIAVPHLGDDAVFDKVVSGLDVTGMANFAAWVHGDATAVRYGGTPVGLPTGAGYSVGNRLVDAYLEATDQTAAQALHVDSGEIIGTALDRLR